MREVLPNLFIGSVAEAASLPDDVGVLSVDAKARVPRTTLVDITDSRDPFPLHRASEFIRAAVDQGGKLMVCGNGGEEVAVLWYLMRYQGMTEQEAFARVQGLHEVFVAEVNKPFILSDGTPVDTTPQNLALAAVLKEHPDVLDRRTWLP